jgi:poly(hydroxyalkanoate) depolymerase family esterase
MILLRRIWNKLHDRLRRLLRRRPPPAPGYTLEGAAWSAQGWIATASMTAPRRKYLLHVPSGDAPGERRPLIVWIHGCHQSPEDFAAATRIVGWADRRGLFVLMPRQAAGANAAGCWNWFDRSTSAGLGETAIVLAQLEAVERDFAIDPRRVFVGGLSSGAALAAALIVRAPQRFAAAGLHSGIACGAAASIYNAQAVMKDGPDTDVAEIGRRANAQTGEPITMPVMIVQGLADDAVAPVHARELARQLLALNGEPATNGAVLRAPDSTAEADAGQRRVLTEDFEIGHRLRVRLVSIEGLGHAWSGGDDRYRFADPMAPDATRMMLDFFDAVSSSAPIPR